MSESLLWTISLCPSILEQEWSLLLKKCPFLVLFFPFVPLPVLCFKWLTLLVFTVIAEGDIVYTKTLLGNGRENYKDKEILILGGGDGGVLHELLKESPKFVTMVEISLKNCCKLEVHAKRFRQHLTRKLSLSFDLKMNTLKHPDINENGGHINS